VNDGPGAITILENGPYLVSGIPLEDPSGTPYEASERYALCRCGGSNEKPFCDGA
jgi:CDGSH-type Zn-finger protein